MPANSQKQPKKSVKKPVSDAPVVTGVKEIVIQGEENTEPTASFTAAKRDPKTNEIIIN